MEAGGTRSFSPINQGPGDVAWFGKDTPAAVDRLVFLRDVAGPLLADCLRGRGPIDLFSVAAQGLQMGDDLHMRTQAATNLFLRTLLPSLMGLESAARVELGRFLAGNHLFFLNLAMAGAKSLTLWAEQVPGSSVVTTMARNGTTYGVRLPGSDEWFVTDSPPVGDALFHPGRGPDDAAPDIGDSAVLELVGLGGCAAAGSPAVAAFVGGTMADAVATTEDMDRVCAGRSSRFKLPILDFRGTPVGVDVRKVVELGITPKVTTGHPPRRRGRADRRRRGPRTRWPASATPSSTSTAAWGDAWSSSASAPGRRWRSTGGAGWWRSTGGRRTCRCRAAWWP